VAVRLQLSNPSFDLSELKIGTSVVLDGEHSRKLFFILRLLAFILEARVGQMERSKDRQRDETHIAAY